MVLIAEIERLREERAKCDWLLPARELAKLMAEDFANTPLPISEFSPFHPNNQIKAIPVPPRPPVMPFGAVTTGDDLPKS